MRTEMVKGGGIGHHNRQAGDCWFREMQYSELGEALKIKPLPINASNYRACVRLDDSASWYGGISTAKEAQELLDKGWKEGAERAMLLKRKIQSTLPEPVSVARRPVWQDEGDEVDMDRVWGGQLDTAWRAAKRRHVRAAQTISIMATYGGNCAQPAEELFWAGAALLALSDALEGAGYRVELSVTFHTGMSDSTTVKNEKHSNVHIIRLKEADEPLRADIVAACAAHAAIFRLYGITMMYGAPRGVTTGAGIIKKAKPVVDRLADMGVIDKPDLFLDTVRNEEGAVRELTKAIGLLDAGER